MSKTINTSIYNYYCIISLDEALLLECCFKEQEFRNRFSVSKVSDSTKSLKFMGTPLGEVLVRWTS